MAGRLGGRQVVGEHTLGQCCGVDLHDLQVGLAHVGRVGLERSTQVSGLLDSDARLIQEPSKGTGVPPLVHSLFQPIAGNALHTEVESTE